MAIVTRSTMPLDLFELIANKQRPKHRSSYKPPTYQPMAGFYIANYTLLGGMIVLILMTVSAVL